MSYDEAFAPAEAHYKKIVMHETWGHLFPENSKYVGNIRIAYSAYGHIDVLDEHVDLPSGSPWWFEAANNFACEVSNNMEMGEVAEFKVQVDIVEHKELDESTADDDEPYYDEYKTIEISTLSKTVLIKAY